MADSTFEPEISRSLKHILKEVLLDYPVAIECKKVSGTSLPFDRVNEHQEEALLKFEEESFYQKMLVASNVGGGKSRFNLRSGFDFLACPHGRSWVLVNFRATKKAAGRDIPKGTNKCFAVSIENYIEGKADLLSEGRKSFPYLWFLNNAMELNRKRWEGDKGFEYGWDLTPLLHLPY